ncbi:MAG: Kelch repeat-containing protein [Bacteroidota bacterium]
MKTRLLLFTLCIAFTSEANYVWTQKASLPASPRIEMASFSIGNDGFIACGIDNITSNVYNDCWQWNSVQNLWTQKASLPASARYGCSGFSVNNKGYVVCGWTSSHSQLKELWQFDPIANAWTAKPNFPGAARYTTTAFVINNDAYVGLGYNPYQTDFYKYDAVAEIWSPIANFPGAARQNASGFSISGKGYVIGGHTDPNTDYTDCYEYDPNTNSWNIKTGFISNGRFGTTEFVFNNLGFYGMGGTYTTNYNDMYYYDPLVDNWQSVTSFPSIARKSCASFSIGNSGYLYGGNMLNMGLTNDLWQLSLATDIDDLNQRDLEIRYVNSLNEFVIQKGTLSEGILTVYDASARKICDIDIRINQKNISIPIQLKPSLYFYQVKLKSKNFTGRFVRI